MLFNDVASQWREIQNLPGNIFSDISNFLSSGPYINGNYVREFENDFAEYCGAKYAVGVSSGTDALKLAIQVLKDKMHPDMEVIIPANAHISSALAPAYFKLKTVLVDCDENHNIDIEGIKEHCASCDKHHLIIATHMYGNPVDICKIRAIDNDSMIIEDCSHAHGAEFNDQHVGTFGDIGIFSLYPTKNLGACGDAGIIITNNKEYAVHLKALRNYGAYEKDDCNNIGWNNRLDEFQALILNEKLGHLNRWNLTKTAIAESYNEILEDVGDLVLPQITDERVFHIYQIRTSRRDQLRNFLRKREIPTLIHYPRPIYKTEEFHRLNPYPEKTPRAEKYAQEILSLPIHPFLPGSDIAFIGEMIEEFFE